MVPRPAVNINAASHTFSTPALPPLSFLSLNAVPSTDHLSPQTPSVQPETGVPHVPTTGPDVTAPSNMANTDLPSTPMALASPDLVSKPADVTSSTDTESDCFTNAPQDDHQQNNGASAKTADEPVDSGKNLSGTGERANESTTEVSSVTEDLESCTTSIGLKERLIPKSVVLNPKTMKIAKERQRQQAHGHIHGHWGPASKAVRQKTLALDESLRCHELQRNAIYKSAKPVHLSKESQSVRRVLMVGCSKNISQNSSTAGENIEGTETNQQIDPQQLENQLLQVQLTQGQQQPNEAGMGGEQSQTPCCQVSHLTRHTIEDDQPFPANPPSSVQEIDITVEETRPILMPDVWKEVDLSSNVDDTNIQGYPVTPVQDPPPVWSRVRERSTAAARWMRQKTIAGFHWMGRRMRSAARTCQDIFGIE